MKGNKKVSLKYILCDKLKSLFKYPSFFAFVNITYTVVYEFKI